MMTLAAFVLVGGVACEQGEGEVGSEQEALEHDGSRGREGRGMKRGMGPGPRFMAQLDLSDEQRSSIDAIQAQSQEANSGIREQMNTLRSELSELWQADQPDAEAILAKEAEMDALRSSVRERMHTQRQAIEEILTAEQREQLGELRANGPTKGRRGKRGPGAGMGRRGGGGGFGHGGPGLGGPGMGGHGMGGPGMGSMGHFGRGGRLMSQLDLTEEQRAQIDALHAQAEEATSEARAELDEVRQAMHAARSADELNEEALDALHARADAAHLVVREQGVRSKIAVLGVLTADQRAELQALRSERGERRGHRRGGVESGAGMEQGPGIGLGRGRGKGFGRGHGKGFGRGPGFGPGGGWGQGAGTRGELAE